jgi:hypothetical protein
MKKKKTKMAKIVLCAGSTFVQQLRGLHPDDPRSYHEISFTVSEKETALATASIWHKRGWNPLCYLIDEDGESKYLFRLGKIVTRQPRRKAA